MLYTNSNSVIHKYYVKLDQSIKTKYSINGFIILATYIVTTNLLLF